MTSVGLGSKVGQRLAVIAFVNGQAVLDGVGRCTRPEAGEEAGLISARMRERAGVNEHREGVAAYAGVASTTTSPCMFMAPMRRRSVTLPDENITFAASKV